MSENSPAEKSFQQRADEFIAVANQQNAETEVENVNAAILFSAARFNVFSTARQFETIEALEKDKQDMINYFTQRYVDMLAQNFDEYVSNFDSYKQK